jgi:hypothetical protein
VQYRSVLQRANDSAQQAAAFQIVSFQIFFELTTTVLGTTLKLAPEKKIGFHSSFIPYTPHLLPFK